PIIVATGIRSALMVWRRALVASLTAVLFMTGCVQAAPKTAAPSAAEVQQNAADNPADCVPGKEVWRSPGPPKRGGTLVRGADIVDHMDMTKTGRTAQGSMPQVYNTLVQYRGCFSSDTAMV